MARILSRDIVSNEGKDVELSGWVNVVRAHGKVLFLDLRDRSGIVQLVFIPSNKELYGGAQELRSEWVIGVSGTVNKRPKGMENANVPNGMHEVLVKELKIISKSETPPIPIDGNGYDIGEESRMKYRYLDLRRERLQKNLRMRHKIMKYVRDFLTDEDFVEVETPVLSKSTPEGARDYLVPSRLQQGNFYALPQSPQQYKQLLMVAGLERYFQFPRCFRDEDTRGDRQPEFTQLDLEMSFVDREEVMALNEKLLIEIVAKLNPEKHIQQIPFPRISYKEAMENYKTDRPDMRKDKNDLSELAFCWVIDFPFFEKTDKGEWTFTHNPFSAPKPEFMDDLLKKQNIENILTTQYDIVLNGWEIGGGSIRNHTVEGLTAVLNIMGHKNPREDFGHMFDAFSYGAPSHGGIAWGLDRFVMILQNEPNIREVIAFPKTGDGRDLMMQAPSEVSAEQLKELGLEIKQKKGNS